MMSGFRASSSSSTHMSKEIQQEAERKIDEFEDNLEKEIISFSITEPSATSSPVNINRHNITYTIRPEEYSVIEKDITSDWNLNDEFTESMEFDESMNKLSSSAFSSSSSSLSPSSSSSISYSLQMAQQMIANYPNEEQLAGMIAENYVNYIAELSGEHQPMIQSSEEEEQAVNMYNDSVILLESVGVQTSFSFEQKEEEQEQEQEQEEEEEEDGVENMQQE